MNPFYQKINAPSREVLELILKIAANTESHSSTIVGVRMYSPMTHPKNPSI
ncbi:hypothetical protein EAQG_02428 [Escherichia coli TA464]|nr:hypothetical protein EAQG_02428 [Escherichia coli TA464]